MIDKRIRTKAVLAIAALKERPFKTFSWFKSWAQNNDNEAVRKAAVREFARGWKEDPDVKLFLSNLKKN